VYKRPIFRTMAAGETSLEEVYRLRQRQMHS
jgi:hypothetical protein